MDERPYLGIAASELSALVGNYPADLAKPAAADLEAIRTRYWERTRKLVKLAPGQRLVDKNPLNMNHLPAIKRLFPRAPIILCVRHPCDVL
ncbi:sulfotransferase, partial [Vibrio parahaemolyticus]